MDRNAGGDRSRGVTAVEGYLNTYLKGSHSSPYKMDRNAGVTVVRAFTVYYNYSG